MTGIKTVGLSKRMEAGVGLFAPALCVADIGCDHAYVSICLKQRKIAQRVIAMDIGEGPLLRAKENIMAHGMDGEIELRLSDGAKALMPGEADAAVIMGMGGPLIEKILEEGCGVFKRMSQIVLGAQSEISHLRQFLYENEYTPVCEHIVFDEGKYYTLMKVINGRNAAAASLEGDLEGDSLCIYYRYGDKNIQKDSELYYAYLQSEKEKMTRLYERLHEAGTDKSEHRKKQIAQELKYIEAAINMA